MRLIAFVLSIVFISNTTIGQVNQKDAKGMKQGEWVKYYPNTRVPMYQGTFKNDKPIGTFTYRYKSNKLKAVIVHTPNSNRSEAVFYHENGQVMTKGIYRDMKKDSVWVSYNEKGRITMSETYKNDLLHGLKKLYYIPDNPDVKAVIIISEENYVNGKIDGSFTEYYPNGKIRKIGQYKNFKREGEWKYYELDGTLISIERYKDGKPHGWFIGYDASGKEGQRRYYYYGELLEGKRLKDTLEKLKAKGINPNG